MKIVYTILIVLVLISCKNEKHNYNDKTGHYSGVFEYGNFTDSIVIDIAQDSLGIKAFFSSLAQNANRIPLQEVKLNGDSINFELRSDFYTYTFKNKWVDNASKLDGLLMVDSTVVKYTLEKEVLKTDNGISGKDVSFLSNGLTIHGTIWNWKDSPSKSMVILSSSGNADRSASRAEAKLLAQKGFTIFHYDKRGTGKSEGNWMEASMDDLLSDDINAIKYFSTTSRIPISQMGIKGSSQGGSKVPYILNEIEELKYGIVVSCPGTSLLESDLNYWKNRNAKLIGSDIDDAMIFQRRVFEHIAGKISRKELEVFIESEKLKPWFSNIWIPDLNVVKTDTKLLYNPVPYFEKVKQHILIIQGTLDEIIPTNSHEVIARSLLDAKNNNFDVQIIKGASHTMHYTEKTDFPYWTKMHPKYIEIIENWLNGVIE